MFRYENGRECCKESRGVVKIEGFELGTGLSYFGGGGIEIYVNMWCGWSMLVRENRLGREILRVIGVGELRRGISSWRENRRWVFVRVFFAVLGVVVGIIGVCLLGLRMDGGGG